MKESTESKPEYTEEDILKLRELKLNFYKGEIKHLKVEAEYEKLVADIEEYKLRGYLSMVKASELYAKTQPQESSEEEKPTKGK